MAASSESSTLESSACKAAAPAAPELFSSFLRLGASSFGGPAMVVYIKQLAVQRKGWLSEEQFQNGLGLCQTLPGATAMQCAAYVGWKTKGLRGALASYVGFGLPVFVFVLALSVAYQRASTLPLVAAGFVGLRAIVVALIANAALSFGRSSVKSIPDALLACATAASFLLHLNPVLIVLGAGLCGAILFRRVAGESAAASTAHLGWRGMLAPSLVLALGGSVIAVAKAVDGRLANLGPFMLKADFLAFGGGFSAIPLMFRDAVDVRHWLPAQAFLDGIALGQVTPGPIVITSTFVGYQTAGLAGATVASVCMFSPSLFVLLLAEPWFDRLRGSAWFRAAVRGAWISFVGLLASVTIQFGRAVPWSIATAVFALAAFLALARKVNILWVVGIGLLLSVGHAVLSR